MTRIEAVVCGVLVGVLFGLAAVFAFLGYAIRSAERIAALRLENRVIDAEGNSIPVDIRATPRLRGRLRLFDRGAT